MDITCPACAAIDADDGTVDGLIAAPSTMPVEHEAARWQRLTSIQDRAADRVTGFAGSLRFVYLHAFWFGFWILCGVGLLGDRFRFDPFPFGLLTMVVSLEAIFLSTFVMVSQNRQGRRAELRSQLDYETNVRAEVWAIHIGQCLGIDHAHVEAVVNEAIEATSVDTTP